MNKLACELFISNRKKRCLTFFSILFCSAFSKCIFRNQLPSSKFSSSQFHLGRSKPWSIVSWSTFLFFSFYDCCILGRILYWAIIQLACTDHPALIFLAAEIVSSFKLNLGIYFQDKDDLRISRLNSFGFWWGFKIIAFELNLNSSDWALRKEAEVFKKTQQ